MQTVNRDTIAWRRAERKAEKEIPPEGTITRAIRVDRRAAEILEERKRRRRERDKAKADPGGYIGEALSSIGDQKRAGKKKTKGAKR